MPGPVMNQYWRFSGRSKARHTLSLPVWVITLSVGVPASFVSPNMHNVHTICIPRTSRILLSWSTDETVGQIWVNNWDTKSKFTITSGNGTDGSVVMRKRKGRTTWALTPCPWILAFRGAILPGCILLTRRRLQTSMRYETTLNSWDILAVL